MSEKKGLTLGEGQQKDKRAVVPKALTVLLAGLLVLSLSACFKTNKAPTPVPEQTQADSDSSSSLGTANNTDVNKWLIPLISEYLMDEPPPPVPMCGDNIGTHTGNLTLTTQAEVNDFLTNGVGKIAGDLILNPSADLDFSPLGLLTEITGKFELADNANQTTLAGFDCLATVGGDFDIGYFDFGSNTTKGNPNLTSISGFSALTDIGGNFSISFNDALTAIPANAFSALHTVESAFRIAFNDALTAIPANAFSALHTVGGGFFIFVNAKLTAIPANAFSALHKVSGSFSISGNGALTAIPADAFSALQTVSGVFDIYGNGALTAIPATTFSALETVDGDFSIGDNDLLTDISGFPLLNTTGAFTIESNDLLTDISGFPRLGTTGGFAIRSNDALTDISGFPLLNTTGDFIIESNDLLTDISGFPLLNTTRLFIIESNYLLTDISGFHRLETTGTFIITINELLTDISGFPRLETTGNFVIGRNELLTNISGFPLLGTTQDFVIQFNEALTNISGFDVLGPIDILGSSTVSDNPMLNCQNPDPNFSPVDYSDNNGTGTDCFTDVAVVGFAYSDNLSNQTYTPLASYSYNSTSGAISGVRPSTGIYTLTFAGLTLENSNVQVSGFSSSDNYCSVHSTSGATVTVHCFDASTDALTDSYFTIAITEKTTTTSTAEVSAYALVDSTTVSNSYDGYGGGITATHPSIGKYSIEFAIGGIGAGANVQVTARDATKFCRISGWTNTTISIDCYDEDGNLANSKYSVTVIDSTPPANTTTEFVGYARYVGGNVADTYNQSGGAVTQMVSNNIITIKFAGLNLTNNYNIQVSIHSSDVGGQDNFCRLGAVTVPDKVDVHCYGEQGTPYAEKFSIWVVQK